MITVTKRYAVELGAAMLAYCIVLAVALTLLRQLGPATPWRIPLALAPMLPLGFALAAILRQIRQLDELAQRIQFEALAFAFAATAMVSLTLGFLENAGVPRPSWIWVWPVMGVLWVVGKMLSTRRYR